MSNSLADGYHAVPPGKLAAVVTSLEMRSKPQLAPPKATRKTVTLAAQIAPTVEWYRDLFTRIGTPWLWVSRLKLSPTALLEIIRHPRVEVHALLVEGRAEGLLELDFRDERACELAFFGVTPAQIGSGAGRLMMATAIERAWARPIDRFWVHTCSFDHPSALSFYQRSGFVPYQRQIEIFDDPRASGILPADSVPDVPRL